MRAAFLIAACLLAGSPADAQTTTLRIGPVDFAVPGDAKVVACPIEVPESAPVICIAVPYLRANDDQNSITLTLVRGGWTFAGGAATQYWIERKLTGGECESLDITGMGPFDLTEAQMRVADAVIMFSYSPKRACRARESAQ